MMKTLIRKNIGRILFITLTVLTLWYLNRVLCIKDIHGTDQARALYYQPRNSIDVAMLGSSHIHCDIDPGLLWKEYGIASFDYSAAEQPLWITYHYLIEFCKYQNPKVVVLDLYASALLKSDYQYDCIRNNIHGLNLSLNKLQMLYAGIEPEMIKDYFPDFVYYHDRIFDVTPSDWIYPFTVSRDLVVFKGFTPYYLNNVQQEPVLDQVESGGLTLKQEIYLQKIIDYTRDNNIGLFLIVSPYSTNSDDERVYNRIKEIALMNSLEFNSTNYNYNEIGLDFETDFNDPSHLNYLGAEKFTRYLGSELKHRFELPDRRNDDRYVSWEQFYSLTRESIKDNTPQ